MTKITKILISTALIVFSTLFVAFKSDDRLFEIAKNLDVFSTMYKELNAFYVDEVNPTRAMRVGIQAMLKELDPYTVFYPEDEIEDYFTMNVGSYNGIGATIESSGNKHLVVMLFEESSADKMGLKIGDEVLKIDGVETPGKSEAEFGRLLKGQTGSKVTLTVKRFGESKPMSFKLERGEVKTPNVPHFGMINDEVGYILLTDFMSPNCAKEIKTATTELKGKGMKKLVLDLRGNPGGLLNMSIEISNFFLPKGLNVVETKGKVKDGNRKYLTNEPPLDIEMPIAVLINGKSASASEIVSGTLQDYDRAVLIGQRSFGKGLVQITRDLTYGTKMKITTSKYYIPSGRCIQAIDYGHRGADGSVAKLPDSLRVAFKTKNGRLVYDGGGVEPDIKTRSGELSSFTKALIVERLIFDYATKYYFENQNQKPAEKFILKDSEFINFENWLKNQNFKFKTADQLSIEGVLKSSKESGEYADMKNSIDNLSKLANAKAAVLITKNKEEIKRQLELEILSRYYYQKAMKFASFEKDEDVQAAISLFKDMNRYNKILSGK